MFSIFLFLIIETFSGTPIKKTDNFVFCAAMLLILIALDNIEMLHNDDSLEEAFNSYNIDNIFEKAYPMYLESLKTNQVDDFLKDKINILKEASTMFTSKDDIKTYFVMKYMSNTSQLENVKTKHADALKSTEESSDNSVKVSDNITNTSNTKDSTSEEIPDISKMVPDHVSENHVTETKETKETNKDDDEFITKKDAVDIIKSLVTSKKSSYLENEDYKRYDPDYYTNKGDLIDRSWENQFVILDTKHWKPYQIPPPVCLGKDDSCVPCPTIMHTPYLELKQFDKSRKILN